MKKQYHVNLTKEERHHLVTLLMGGTQKVREVKRAQILLKANDGWTDAQVAEAPARRALRRYLVTRPEGESDALFLGQRGRRIGRKTVQRAVWRFSKQAGLKRVSPHVLRHTFAKSLVDNGVSLEKVAALLGHSDLNTTRRYVTPGERDLQDAVEGLE